MTVSSRQPLRPGCRALVTGASGFVGRTVTPLLLRAGYRVRASSRAPVAGATDPQAVEWVQVAELSGQTDWSKALQDVDAVVHLAARVHHLREGEREAATLYRRTNYEGTVRLAEMAMAAGVQRFVFLSSIKVNGERTARKPDGSWRRDSEEDVPQPHDAYAQSKWEAEQALQAIAERGDMSVTILRPPLVYGPGVGANFLRLLRAVQKGVPLPFANVVNLRSLLYVENLAEVIRVCLESRAAANRIYVIGDVDVSTPDLIRAIGRALGRTPSLIGLPSWMLRVAGAVTGRGAAVSRLLDSLLVDDTRLRRELSWTPSIGLEEGLSRTAAWLGEKTPSTGELQRRPARG